MTDMNDKLLGEFSWNELSTMDVSGSKDFYGKLLGWNYQDIKCGEIDYTVFKYNNKDVAGLMQTVSGCECHSNKKAMWLSYVNVEDVDKVVKKVEGLGGKIILQPRDIPTVGRIAIIADPSGATIGLFAK